MRRAVAESTIFLPLIFLSNVLGYGRRPRRVSSVFHPWLVLDCAGGRAASAVGCFLTHCPPGSIFSQPRSDGQRCATSASLRNFGNFSRNGGFLKLRSSHNFGASSTWQMSIYGKFPENWLRWSHDERTSVLVTPAPF